MNPSAREDTSEVSAESIKENDVLSDHVKIKCLFLGALSERDDTYLLGSDLSEWINNHIKKNGYTVHSMLSK